MQARRPLFWALAGLLSLLASPLHAFVQPVPAGIGEVAAPEGVATHLADAARARSLENSPAWLAFRSAHGPWSAMWNAATGTPHRAFGPSIPLAGFRGDPGGVDAAVRGFVAANPALFGTVSLETAAIQQAGGVWYAHYRQMMNGMPVLFSDWEFRVGNDGRLMAFGADARLPSDGIPTPRLVPAAARIAATAGLSFDATRDRTEGGELALLPLSTETGVGYRPVYQVRVHTVSPLGNWAVLVDAENGAVLWRANRVRYAISGTITGDVHLVLPTEPLTTSPMAHLTVNVGPTAAPTDNAGVYSASAVGTVSVNGQILGLYCNINRQDGPADASFSTTATDPAIVDFAWTPANSHDAERDAFYHMNIAHDHAKSVDPGFIGNDYMMPGAVNIANTCNAFWDGFGLNFFAAGGGCPNTGTMPDVIYHEYGHGVNDNLYVQAGSPGGMFNGALHEGMADVNAALIQDSPDVGKGFFGPGTVLRQLDLGNRWPEDRSGDGHITGLIIAGAFWDLRQSLGLATANHLAHFAKYGTPDDADDGVAMSEFFVETLVADDNDANLGNGTPNAGAIVAAFNAHGIGTNFFLTIGHTPLGDQVGAAPYPVTATFQYAGPIGTLNAASPTLHYQVGSSLYTTVPMTPTGNPNEYTAPIPSQSGAIVRYFLTAEDSFGQPTSSPTAGAASPYVFLAGATNTLIFHNQEVAQGWTAGAAGDNATTGLWTRVNPVGTFVGIDPVQPEDDHTPDPAVFCFVTGQHTIGQSVGANDVDGGRTTLLTPIFDASTANSPILEYYRWYSNNLGGAPGEDFWRVDVSNDGGLNWASVESTRDSQNSWKRVLFRISDIVAPTANMRLRFIAEDAGSGSLVEAAVDDFRLVEFQGAVAVEDAEGVTSLALAPATPNPFAATTQLSYRLATAGPVALRIYDLSGRLVRVLDQGVRAGGEHRAVWDGRDAEGRPVASGVYLARLSAGGQERQRTLVRMH
jgi:Zn-dependent metalloprotease